MDGKFLLHGVDMEKEYYDAQVKYMNEARSIRHDMQAHMIILQYYLEEEKYDKASEYLQKMQKRQSELRIEHTDTGNDLVNVIVQDVINRSGCPIRMICHGYFPQHMPIDDYDICTLFSNMLSNACEACEKLVVYRPEVQLEIEQREQGLFIAIQNPIEWEIDSNTLGRGTTKTDKIAHGYGVKNMIEVIKKNRGKIDFYVSERSFRLEILL